MKSVYRQLSKEDHRKIYVALLNRYLHIYYRLCRLPTTIL